MLNLTFYELLGAKGRIHLWIIHAHNYNSLSFKSRLTSELGLLDMFNLHLVFWPKLSKSQELSELELPLPRCAKQFWVPAPEENYINSHSISQHFCLNLCVTRCYTSRVQRESVFAPVCVRT